MNPSTPLGVCIVCFLGREGGKQLFLSSHIYQQGIKGMELKKLRNIHLAVTHLFMAFFINRAVPCALELNLFWKQSQFSCSSAF